MKTPTESLFTWDLESARGPKETEMRQVLARAERADVEFPERAAKFVIRYLSAHRQASSEEMTDAAKKAGIIPPDDRAFGPIYSKLSRAKEISKAGFCVRRKGHLTSGGIIWKLNG